MDYYEVVKKLVGRIEPIGETNEDGRRLENLKEMTSLVDKLVYDIADIANQGHRQEFSMKRASDYAGDFLAELRDACDEHGGH